MRMNRRANLFYITTVAVAIICLILDLAVPNNTFSYLGICFALTMLVYGVCLIICGLKFKIDSSLFLGIIIFIFGAIGMLTHFTKYGYLDLWHYLLLGAALSSFITGIYFKVNSLKKLTILFLGLFIWALLFQLNIYKVWVMLIIMPVWVLGFIIINNMIISRRR